MPPAPKYVPEQQPIATTPEAGGTIYREAGQEGVAAAHGEAVQSPEVAGEAAREARRRDLYDNAADKVLTFGEGVVDSLSLGLLHQTGENADLRREVNSGSALLGELSGTLLGLKLPGPVAWAAEGGEVAGAKAAKLLGAGKIASRGLTEAGIGASLMGAGSVGHQITDTLLDDKPFAGEAVLKDVGLGALLGGGAGLLGGLLSARAAKGSMEAQGGLLDPKSPASVTAREHVHSAIAAMDRAVEENAAKLGVLQGLNRSGEFPELGADFVAERSDLLAKARAAREKLGDRAAVDKAIKGLDPDFFAALDDYQDALPKLDRSLQGSVHPSFEQGVSPISPGRAEAVPGFGHQAAQYEDLFVGADEVPKANQDLNRAMAADYTPGAEEAPSSLYRYRQGPDEAPSSPMYYRQKNPFRYEPGMPPEPVQGFEGTGAKTPSSHFGDVRGQYEEIYGRPYEPVEGGTGEPPPMEGGKVTPTSEEGTNVGKIKTPKTPAEAEGPVEGARKPWAPESAPGKFTMSDFSPDTLAGEVPLSKGRILEPKAKELLNSAYSDETKVLLPDGYMAPLRDAKANAEAFAAFQDRMATDTMASKAKVSSSASGGEQLLELDPETPRSVRDVAPDGEPNNYFYKQGAPYQPQPLKEVLPDSPGPGATPEVRAQVEAWYNESRQYGPRYAPGDIAASRIGHEVQKLMEATGGRLDSIAGLDVGPRWGLPEPRHALTERAQQLGLLHRSAEVTKELATGAKTGGTSLMAKKILGAAIGHAIGGSAGGFAGYYLAARYAGAAGQMAASAGKLMTKIAAVGAKVLAPRLASGLAVGAARNHSYAYSDAGPIKDPTERIQELKRVAASPDALRAALSKQVGDLAAVHPQMAQAIVEKGVQQVTMLSLKAPAIYFNALGAALPIPAQKMRKFLEAENTLHDLERCLDMIGAGTATPDQMEACAQFYPEVHAKIVMGVLQDQEALKKLPQAKLKYVEQLSGIRLTPGGDPLYTLRQQASWQPPQPAQPPAKAQSLKMKTEAPLPDQSATGRAPGN